MARRNRSAKQEAVRRSLRRANRLQHSNRDEFLPKGIGFSKPGIMNGLIANLSAELTFLARL